MFKDDPRLSYYEQLERSRYHRGINRIFLMIFLIVGYFGLILTQTNFETLILPFKVMFILLLVYSFGLFITWLLTLFCFELFISGIPAFIRWLQGYDY
jgi:hypothetical protein